MSDSDSSLELHDTNADEIDFFNYEDPALEAPEILAVIDNNVALLTSLLENGRYVNISDNFGRTPLHIAVEENKREAFDFLLTVEDIWLDAVDFEGETPLLKALILGAEYYAYELLKKGVDVNVYKRLGTSPLYFVSGNLVLAQTLLEKGFDINCQNYEGDTLLHIACEKNQTDFAYFLLYYGADPMIANANQFLPFTICLYSAPELEEILFNYTFDKYTKEVSLLTLLEAMKHRSCYFYELLKMNVTYDVELQDGQIAGDLCDVDVDMVLSFMNKFPSIFSDLISHYNPFLYLFAVYTQERFDFFFRLSETEFIGKIIENYKCWFAEFQSVIAKLPEDDLSKFILCVLSYGGDFYFSELIVVYKYHGFGNLFKILVHMDISSDITNFKNMSAEAILTNFIYNLHQNLDFFALNPRRLLLDDLELLNKFFVHPCLTEVFEHFDRKVRTVPSLLEFSRNCTRKHIIDKFKVKHSRQFFTVLRWLPICDVYKAILSFEKQIYS